MNNYYDTFRRKSNSTRCSNRSKANLVNNSAGTTEVLHRRVNKNIEVNLVITNRTEGLGTAKIYTWAKDDLRVGDYFVWKKTYIFLVTEQENNVLLDENIHKFAARECNALVEYKSEGSNYLDKNFDAVFIGRGNSKANPFLRTRESNPMLLLDTKDLIIFSGENLERFKSFMIRNQQWDVLDWDATTAYPIIYCTVEQTPVTLVETDVVEEPVFKKYKAGLQYEFITTNYYYSSNETLQVERQKDKVLITMPYNVESITFYTKEGNDTIENIIKIEQ